MPGIVFGGHQLSMAMASLMETHVQLDPALPHYAYFLESRVCRIQQDIPFLGRND